MNHSYIALIPAYKPGPVLLELTQNLREKGFSVVIVDDGSGPQYESLFLECSGYAQLLRYEENAGKGQALKTGFSYIARCADPNAVVVTIDADGQHRIGDALAICQLVTQNPNAPHYVFVVSDGRTGDSEGLSLYELAEFMQSLGVKKAYNLDGGGSSTMVFNGKVINNPTTSGRSVKERSVSDIVYIGY